MKILAQRVIITEAAKILNKQIKKKKTNKQDFKERFNKLLIYLEITEFIFNTVKLRQINAFVVFFYIVTFYYSLEWTYIFTIYYIIIQSMYNFISLL